MKILFISVNNNLYGANRAMLNLIEKLQDRGIICEVLLLRGGDIETELSKLNVRYYIHRFCPWLVYETEPAWKNAIRKIYNIYAFSRIEQKLRKNEYDIVHTNSSVTEIGAYLANKWHCKHVWHIRENACFHKLTNTYKDYPLRNIYKIYKVYKKTYENGAIIGISKYISNLQNKSLGEQWCRTIYDGIPIKNPIHKREHNGIVFCISGALSTNKNQLKVCEAMNELVNKGYTNIYCYIIGSASEFDYEVLIKKYITDRNLDKYIEMTGFVNNPYEYYAKSDIGIMASSFEGFGLVTVEYMMNEMMVLGNKGGATPELIDDGETGLIFDINKHGDLVSKMEYCIIHRDEIEAYGKRARKSAIDKFSIDFHATNILNVYRELLDDRK